MKVAVEDINNKPVPLRLDLRVNPSSPAIAAGWRGGRGVRRLNQIFNVQFSIFN